MVWADVFGIAYKPFKKTIDGSGNRDASKGPRRAFEDEEEFEQDLKSSALLKEGGKSSQSQDTALSDDADNEFDFEDSPERSAVSSDLRKILAKAAKDTSAEPYVVEKIPNTIQEPLSACSESAAPSEEEPVADKNYDAYGNAKDALQAIVDVYGCGLGDQEIVIMNSLGADAVTKLPTTAHRPTVALGDSIVPGTGTVSRSSNKPSKRTSGIKIIKSRIERDKIIEEDEEDFEQREKERDEAQREEAIRSTTYTYVCIDWYCSYGRFDYLG